MLKHPWIPAYKVFKKDQKMLPIKIFDSWSHQCQLFRLWRHRDWQDLSYSFSFYGVSFFYLLSIAFFFLLVLSPWKDQITVYLSSIEVATGILLPMYGNIQFLFILIIPILCMNAYPFSKHIPLKKQIQQSLISSWTLVFAPWFNRFLIIQTWLGLTGLFFSVVLWGGYRDIFALMIAWLGLTLSSMALLSFALFWGSLFEKSILNFLVPLLLSLIWVFMGSIHQFIDDYSLIEFISSLSLIHHFSPFAQGSFSLHSCLFFITTTFFFFILGVGVQYAKRG